ncbi:MAG TPA: hypothetical protein VIA18_18705, partial [Polyangia bacterium]|nr:hypothetical protein [Polyangia bacterium]
MPSGVNVPASSVSARDDRAAAATIDDSRPRAIEVHALFEDTIIAVACLANPHGGRASRATKALFATGAAALMIPIVSFVVAYVDVPRVRAWDDWNRANHAHNAFVLPLGGFAIDIAAALFGVAAVVLLVVAALRWASERTARDFTIGSGRDALVHAPVEQLPLASFPLVHAVGDDYSLSFTAHMSGDVTLADGQSASLAQLVESGAARASHDLDDAWSWPIPRDAHACIRLMHTTFHVTSVEPPRVYELARAIDWQTQVYTLVTGLSVLLFLFMVNRIPGAPRSLSLDPFLHETRFARFLVRPPDEPSMAIPAWLREHASSGNQGL